MILNILEWAGAITGLIGAFLLATNTHISRYGWLFFLAANVFLMAMAFGIHRYGLLVQQAGFTASSLVGIYRTRIFHFKKGEPLFKKTDLF